MSEAIGVFRSTTKKSAAKEKDQFHVRKTTSADGALEGLYQQMEYTRGPTLEAVEFSERQRGLQQGRETIKGCWRYADYRH